MKYKTVKVDLKLISGGVNIWYISEKAISERFPDLSFINARGKTIMSADGDWDNPVIWISNESQYRLEGVLAHEAIHASYELLRQRGITIDEELLAYCVEYIVSEGLKKLKKR